MFVLCAFLPSPETAGRTGYEGPEGKLEESMYGFAACIDSGNTSRGYHSTLLARMDVDILQKGGLTGACLAGQKQVLLRIAHKTYRFGEYVVFLVS